MGRLCVPKCKVIRRLTQTIPLLRILECQPLQNGTCRDRLLLFQTSDVVLLIYQSVKPTGLVIYICVMFSCLLDLY